MKESENGMKSAMLWIERFGGLGLLGVVLYFVFVHLIPAQASTFERALDKQTTAFERNLKEQREDFIRALKELKEFKELKRGESSH